MEKEKFMKTKNMILCSLFAALITIGAFIKIPLPITMFSLQFTFVLLSGVILGAKLGAIANLLYVAIGLMGFPVFTEGGGLMYLMKPSFGYLLSFIVTAFVVGYLSETWAQKSKLRLVLSCLLGMVITYFIGSMYTYMILRPIPYIACIAGLFPLAFAKDVFSCVVVGVFGEKIKRTIKKRR